MTFSVGGQIVAMSWFLFFLFSLFIDVAKIGRSPLRPAEWRNYCRGLKHKRVAAFSQAIARVADCSEILSV